MMRRVVGMLKNEIGSWKMKEEEWRFLCKVDAELRSLTMVRSSGDVEMKYGQEIENVGKRPR